MALSNEDKKFFKKYLWVTIRDNGVDFLNGLGDGAITKLKTWVKNQAITDATNRKNKAETELTDLS